MDGGFFEFKLLADERFAHFGALVTGQPLASLEDNRALRDLLQEGHLRSWSVGQVQLASSAAIGWLAQLLTWWTVIIEGVLAVAFLLPDSRRAALVRNAGLLIFAATTYAVANVQGFGWALMLLGMAQCDDRDRDFRAAYLGGFLLLQIYTFPLSAIVDVVLSR
jgi:hypothetical protein